MNKFAEYKKDPLYFYIPTTKLGNEKKDSICKSTKYEMYLGRKYNKNVMDKILKLYWEISKEI